jgi:hypothetical protein
MFAASLKSGKTESGTDLRNIFQRNQSALRIMRGATILMMNADLV